jgi:hypothetical protein
MKKFTCRDYTVSFFEKKRQRKRSRQGGKERDMGGKRSVAVKSVSYIGIIRRRRVLSSGIYILSTHLRLGLPSGPFPSGFPTNLLYAFLFSLIRAR